VSGGQQFRLTFPTTPDISYEVRYRAALTDAWAPVQFTTVQGATPNTTVFTGNGLSATIYVNAPGGQGYFSLVRYFNPPS
jgi:hypothetical protein